MDNRRLFLAAFLSLAVLVAWQFLFPAPDAPVPAAVEPSAAAPASGAPSSPLVPLPGGAPPQTGASQPSSTLEIPRTAAEIEERVVVENPWLRAEFSNRGARLLSFRAKGQGVKEAEGLELVRERAKDEYPFALVGADGAGLPLNQALFVVERTTSPDRGDVLTFRYSGALGQAVKQFEFSATGAMRLDFTLPNQGGWGVLLGPGLRNLDGKESKSQFTRRSAVYLLGDEVETVDAQDAEGAQALPPGLSWVGLEDTYFLTALLPETPVSAAVAPALILESPGSDGARFAGLPPKAQRTKEQKELTHELFLTVSPAGDRLSARGYFGAKQHDRLTAIGGGLERTIHWGQFGILARFFRLVLQKIHDQVVANYGWAIVLLTVAIKIVLLPLTHKSYVSMKKMQELNPKITAIRERWRTKLKDKQGKPNLEAQRKMQEEMNALFKAEGASPIGGCLPMLLQMPILFGFYSLLSTAVELRGAPWLLWVRDLSAADPYYVLPIVMGATQLIQQRMMPQASDPIQRRLFQLMPVFFTVLFLGFPTGLVLYWLVNNVLSIAQQGVYNALQKRKATA